MLCRLNGSAFIFIFVYRFGSLAVCCTIHFATGARTKKSIQIVGKMRLKPKHPDQQKRWQRYEQYQEKKQK